MTHRWMLAPVAALSLGLSPCVGDDVTVDLGPPDLAPPADLSRLPDLAPPSDLVLVPDLSGFAEAPDPYKPGTPRLSIGAFYEGGASETVAVDNKTSHLYIYPNGNTLVVADEGSDKLEGYLSSKLTVAGGLGWFGMGLHWDGGRDLGSYAALHLALKSSASSMSDVVIGMNSPMANPQTAKLNARNYGYSNDGAWHRLTIPLSDFKGVNPNPLQTSQVMAPLVVLNAGLVKDGDVLLLDDVYLE